MSSAAHDKNVNTVKSESEPYDTEPCEQPCGKPV